MTIKPVKRKSRSRVADAVVVGAGPAGLTAAIQLVRQGIKTIVLEKGRPGGQIRTANLVENFPGMFGMKGEEAADEFVDHARKIGVKILKEEALRINPDLTVITNSGKWRSKAVIVATGAVPLKIGNDTRHASVDLEHPSSLNGKSVLILGGGDAAFDRGLRLSGIASSVTIICRGRTSALELLVKRAINAGVRIVQDAGESRPISSGKGALVSTRKGVFCGDALLLCIGKGPNTSILPTPLEKLSLQALTGETNIPGLFVIGDAMAGEYRQLGVAVGTAIASAMRTGKYLKDKYGIQGTSDGWE